MWKEGKSAAVCLFIRGAASTWLSARQTEAPSDGFARLSFELSHAYDTISTHSSYAASPAVGLFV